MHTLGFYKSAMYDMAGDLVINFTVDKNINPDELQELKDKRLAIDFDIYREPRSLQANRYFWKLCDLIAKKLNSDKDTIYLMMLQSYGVFDYLEVIEAGVKVLEPMYRYIETVGEYESEIRASDGVITVLMKCIRCYSGSHTYNSLQMHNLIQGTIKEATDLGIPTLTETEINEMCAAWRCKHDAK